SEDFCHPHEQRGCIGAHNISAGTRIVVSRTKPPHASRGSEYASARKIQDQMLVVNDSCNMSWSDRNRISSKVTPARTLLEHHTLARGNESIPEPTPRDPG